MSEIVSFVGQKGGTGKSTLARAFAVEAAKAKAQPRVMIADLDEAQRTSWEWGQRRAANALMPAVPVEMVPHLQVFAKADAVDLLVVDTPGWADSSTVWLARGSQLTVLSTGASIDDLNPTIRLMHELDAKEIPEWRIALVLCRTQTETEAAFARHYLRQAKKTALAEELRERKSFRDLQNTGHAITESAVASLNNEAYAVIRAIAAALAHSQTKQQELDRDRKPMRLEKSKDRGHSR